MSEEGKAGKGKKEKLEKGYRQGFPLCWLHACELLNWVRCRLQTTIPATTSPTTANCRDDKMLEMSVTFMGLRGGLGSLEGGASKEQHLPRRVLWVFWLQIV